MGPGWTDSNATCTFALTKAAAVGGTGTHSHGANMRKTIVAMLAALLAVPAVAEENPLAGTSVTQVERSISFATSLLPKGWWTIGNRFDLSKTALLAEAKATETACSDQRDSDLRVSSTDGQITYTTRKSPSGNTTGYYWQYSGWSLAGLANTYANVFQCGKYVETYGCNQARPVEFSVTAFEKSSSTVRTYTDAFGVPQPVVFTSTFSLPAIQLADVTLECPPEPPASPDCGSLLNACKDPCQAACANGKKKDEATCKSACVDTCQVAVHEDVEACFPAAGK